MKILNDTDQLKTQVAKIIMKIRPDQRIQQNNQENPLLITQFRQSNF